MDLKTAAAAVIFLDLGSQPILSGVEVPGPGGTITRLTPGVEYRLWATRDAVPFGGTYAEVGRAIVDGTGSVTYQLQTTSPGGLGFDLNTVQGDITIVTSWWSGQKLVVNADSTLSTAV